MLKTNVEYIGMISIHALRKESDVTFNALYCVDGFQSTLSVRRATCDGIHKFRQLLISIHALRKESD